MKATEQPEPQTAEAREGVSKLQKHLTELVTYNWKPKLACLALAVVIWLVVNFFFVQSGANKEWNFDDIRLSLPD